MYLPGMAKGRRTSKPPGEMNKTEKAYGQYLDLQKATGEIAWWQFGAMKFKLADKCWYHCDFIVMLNDGTIEIRETKGHMEDDAAAKLRMLASLYWMFRIVLVKRSRTGGWCNTEYTRPADA